MPQNPLMFQVMAWCCQATSHYLSQCWSRCVAITRPQWVKITEDPHFNTSTTNAWVIAKKQKKTQIKLNSCVKFPQLENPPNKCFDWTELCFSVTTKRSIFHKYSQIHYTGCDQSHVCSSIAASDATTAPPPGNDDSSLTSWRHVT